MKINRIPGLIISLLILGISFVLYDYSFTYYNVEGDCIGRSDATPREWHILNRT